MSALLDSVFTDNFDQNPKTTQTHGQPIPDVSLKKSSSKKLTVRVIFDTEVDISDYDKFFPNPEDKMYQKNGRFVKFTWWKIPQEYFDDPFHDDLRNIAIRASDDRDYASMAVKMTSIGFLTSFFPPIINIKTGKPKNGRGRIKLAIHEGIKYLPVALYSYDDSVTDEDSDVDDGLVANVGTTIEEGRCMDDIFNGAREKVALGTLELSKTKVKEWLESIKIYDDFAPDKVTTITNKIMEGISSKGDPLHIPIEYNDVVVWLKDCKQLKDEFPPNTFKGVESIKTSDINSGNLDTPIVLLYNGSSDTNPLKALRHVLRASKIGRKILIVLYFKKCHDPDKASEYAREFQKNFDELVGLISCMVNRRLGENSPFLLDTPFKCDDAKILGCVPQKNGTKDRKHKILFKEHKLIATNEY